MCFRKRFKISPDLRISLSDRTITTILSVKSISPTSLWERSFPSSQEELIIIINNPLFIEDTIFQQTIIDLEKIFIIKLIFPHTECLERTFSRRDLISVAARDVYKSLVTISLDEELNCIVCMTEDIIWKQKYIIDLTTTKYLSATLNNLPLILNYILKKQSGE